MLVRAEKLGMTFRDANKELEIFRDLSLHVESGSSLAIIGESGAGKTTLLHLLGGLDVPSYGDVFIGDTSITEVQRKRKDLAPFRRSHIGFVFQFNQLLPEFDAVENVAMPLRITGVASVEASKRAEELLKEVGLGERLHHRPGQLSGGEQQRVAIARALCNRPGLILADEPTGNLDIGTGSQISELLLRLHRQEKNTLIVVTHSLELAWKMDRVVELSAQGLSERQKPSK